MELTPRLRKELKKPLGEVAVDTSTLSSDVVIVSVGDTASDTLLSEGYEPRMVVYDGRTGRHEVGVSETIKSFDAKEYCVVNPAGHLVEDVFDLFKELLGSEEPSKVYVEGEEDLTALAAIMEAPDGALVVYGQPDEGLVLVEVNDTIKDKVKGMLEEMEDGS